MAIAQREGKTDCRFHPLCRRQYRIERVDARLFPDILPQSDPDLVRFILTGESDTAPNLDRLTELALPHFFHVELRDETTLPQQLWDRAGEETLTGLFLQEMRRLMDGASPEEEADLLLAARFGLAALEGREDIRP